MIWVAVAALALIVAALLLRPLWWPRRVPTDPESDLAFHREICLASKNEIVITLWQGLARHVLMIFGREILTEAGQSRIVDQHREFIATLLADEDAALPEVVERHIMRLRRPLR